MNSESKYIDYYSRLTNGFFPKLLLSYVSLVALIIIVSFTTLSISNFFSTGEFAITSVPEEDIDESILEPRQTTFEIFIEPGDSLYKILASQDIDQDDIKKIITAAREMDLPRSLQVGKKIVFDYDTQLVEQDDVTLEKPIIKQVTYYMDREYRIEITRAEDNSRFNINKLSVPLRKVIVKYTAVIESSLLEAAKNMSISTNSFIDVINAYSYEIDFQRNIKSGDTIELLSEKFYNEQNKFSHHGKIIFASLNLSGKIYNIYNFNHKTKNSYFSEDGRSVKRNLLRTPVKVTRISSHYGKRTHPILGYTKMHKGVDFAAPIGTPIYAAGTGVITEIGWKGSYGRYIRISHNSGVSTAYAHLNKFAKNLKRGSKVKQGQIVAYVGKTGRATGPHLHYEVLINNKQVNPMSIRSTPETKLAGQFMKDFEYFKHEIQDLNHSMPHKQELAVEKVKLKFYR